MLHKKCFYLILSIVVIIICIFLYYNLYFFQDFIPVSSLNDDWTNVYELEEKEYSRCIEITNHIMNENVYNVRYVNTNTNDINNMVQVKAGINKISKLEAHSSFNVDIKRVSEPNLKREDKNLLFYIYVYPDNIFSRFIRNFINFVSLI